MTKEEISRNLAIARQTAAIPTGFCLPLSTIAQPIAASIFILLAIATADVQRFATTMRSPAAWLPVTLFAPVLFGATVMMPALRSPYSAPLLLLTANCEPHRRGSKRIEGPAR
jgi:hypothetical protein